MAPAPQADGMDKEACPQLQIFQIQEVTQCELWRRVEPSFRVSQYLPRWLHPSNLSVLVCKMKLKFPPFRASVRTANHVNAMFNKGPGIQLVFSKR